MLRVHNALDTAKLVHEVCDVGLASEATLGVLVAFGFDGTALRQPSPWRCVACETARGPALVLFRPDWRESGHSALVRVYGDGGACAGSEDYDLSDVVGRFPETRYFAVSPLATRDADPEEVQEVDVDDSPTARVTCDPCTGLARVAELDQFYHKEGSWHLVTSDPQDPEVLARALLRGWRAVEDEVDARMTGRAGRPHA